MPDHRQLTAVLSQFARTLVTDAPIQGILDQLVLRIVDVLPVTSAGVSLMSPSTGPRMVAASDDAALRFEQFQVEKEEGPCVLAYRTGEAVAVPDLDSDPRFRDFAANALSDGLAAVFTFPLRNGGRCLGALDLYRTTPGALDEEDMAVAQTLADVTTAYLLNAQVKAELAVASETAQLQALHDSLTGLPNRTLLLDRLTHAMQRSRRIGRHVAVIYTDLDGFKQVNDTFGHQVGDELLVALAERLTGLLRPGDTLARLAGDEFVVLCEGLEELSEARGVATRVGRALVESFSLSGVEVSITASVGVAFAGHETSPEDLLHEADTAMYQVKQDGGAGQAVLDAQKGERSRDRQELASDLRAAVRAGTLRPEYQPLVETSNRRVVGAEALLRWTHASRGPVPPALFIPLAEQTGLIGELGRTVLEQACRDRGSWSRTNGEGLRMAVNVSPRQLMSWEFAATVEGVLEKTRTPPDAVVLEVTESALTPDKARALGVLRALRGLGVHLALDDFGTAGSSLDLLRDFPVDIVKLDRVLVGDLGPGSVNRLLVGAVVTMAHRMDVTVVAEGVETEEDFASVRELGCDLAQGYLFSASRSAETFQRLFVPNQRSGERELRPGPLRGA